MLLVLTLTGLGMMWMAEFADVAASLLVVGNGLRLLRANTSLQSVWPLLADILAAMRRLIAIVLLLLLPLQAIWAASEPYCQHEQGQGTFHVGHHMHQDHDQDHGDQGDHAKKAIKAFVDHDHHCCGSLSMVSAAMSLLAPLAPAELVAAPPVTFIHFDATRIERPKWPISL